MNTEEAMIAMEEESSAPVAPEVFVSQGLTPGFTAEITVRGEDGAEEFVLMVNGEEIVTWEGQPPAMKIAAACITHGILFSQSELQRVMGL